MITQQSPVNSLFDEMEDWSRHQTGWSITLTRRSGADTTSNTTESMLIQTPPAGRIYVEPVGEDSKGAYIVEMYAWPTLIRVFLVRQPNSTSWEVRTDAGIPFYWEWNETNFVRLVKDLQVLP